jgi:protocatechuate 3,4-dioxygenase beta subunit
MKTFSTLIILLGILMLTSCESQEHICVTVVDDDNSQPVDSVLVEVRAGNNGVYDKNYDDGYTDEAGVYETHMMIGCSFGCYDIQTTFIKDGYKTITQLNNTVDTVALVKE